ncbi:ATP synthase subunit b', chloroplastic [Selaginella moellendorffii]|nr:ATP synthase subunit b', chloroplastic [Selaginella moellendorffii]|eukprot:XP_002966595.2 ATP synthase subunit b', chloroplastic [Selaginella moellendorffii]
MATCSAGALVIRCPVSASLCKGSPASCKAKVGASPQEWLVKRLSRAFDGASLRNAAFGALNLATLSLPAALALAAEEKKEPGKLFDFDATLPIIVAEFLFLMVALDKIWFTPVGKIMDERDEMIRNKLESVKDNSEEIKKLQDEAEALIQAARAETTAALNKMKKETAAELEAKLQKSRERIEQELAQALANLEEQKQETLKSLETQVQELSDKIVEKVLPVKAK